jgi:hypothetical protein
MLEALGYDTQGQSLDTRNSFVAVTAIAHDTGQSRHFGEPAAIVFALDLDR